MVDKKNLYYNKYLKPNANKLRKSMTKAEACLWKYVLKARLMNGYQFRRERPVLNYIADFMCKELKLIVEVDGITHHFEENYLHDLKRQEELESLGFKVVRFKDNDVLGNIEGVRLELERVVAELETVHPQLKKVRPLNPPPAGENEKVNFPPAEENGTIYLKSPPMEDNETVHSQTPPMVGNHKCNSEYRTQNSEFRRSHHA